MSSGKRRELPPPRLPLQSSASSSSCQLHYGEDAAHRETQSPLQASGGAPVQEDNTTQPASEDTEPQDRTTSSEEGQEQPPSHGEEWDIAEEEERLMVAALEEYESQAKRPKH